MAQPGAIFPEKDGLVSSIDVSWCMECLYRFQSTLGPDGIIALSQLQTEEDPPLGNPV